MKNSLAILDIGSSTVVSLIGQLGANHTFKISGKGEISYAGFQDANFLEPENLKMVIASAISNAEISSGEKVGEVVVGVPGEFCGCIVSDIFVDFEKTKRIKQSDFDNIIREDSLTANTDISYEIINKSLVYFDIDDNERVINPVGKKCKVLSGQMSYILASKYFLNIIGSIFDEMGITVSAYVSSTLAESLYLVKPEVRDKYAIIVDVGYISTSVAVARGNALLSLNSFSLGGGFITSDLAECLKIQFNEAERLKHKILMNWQTQKGDVYSLEGDELLQTFSAKATNEIAGDRIEMICEYILKCLDNCEYDLPDFLPVYVTGGGLNYIVGVRSILAKKLKRNIELVAPELPNMNKPDYSSEVGLLDLVINNKELLYSLIY